MTDQITMPLTARQASTHLAISMDGRAINLAQERLLFDPSPQADSVFEHLRDLIDQVADANVRRSTIAPLLASTRQLMELNRKEGAVHMDNAGAWDDLASRLLDVEMQQQLTLKGFVRAIGAPLKVIANSDRHSRLEIARAYRDFYRLLPQMPEGTLESTYTRNQLKDTRFRLLVELAQEAGE